MYTISCGSPSLLFKEIYKCSDKHETLLVETALVHRDLQPLSAWHPPSTASELERFPYYQYRLVRSVG